MGNVYCTKARVSHAGGGGLVGSLFSPSAGICHPRHNNNDIVKRRVRDVATVHTHIHTIMYSNSNNNKCYIINNERVVSSHTMLATDRSENRKNVRGQCKVDTDRISRVTDLLPRHHSFYIQYRRLDVV